MKGFDKTMKKIILIIFIIIAVICIQGITLKDNYSESISKAVTEDLVFSDVKTINKYGESSVISANYPLFEGSTINTHISNLTDKYISTFKKAYKKNRILDSKSISELNIDYEVFIATDNIISVKFTIIENMDSNLEPQVSVEAINYDLIKDRVIELDDIMEGQYLRKISSLALNFFKDNEIYNNTTNKKSIAHIIRAEQSNYTNFILQNDRIVFSFHSKLQGTADNLTLEVPYTQLKEHIKTTFLDLEAMEKSIVIVNEKELDNNFEMLAQRAMANKMKEFASIRRIYPDKPMVALTFDDGPYTRSTIPILDTLTEHNVVATFFVLGNRVSTHKEIIKRMHVEGNEIGNHTYNHSMLTSLSREKARYQIEKTQSAILEVIGSEPKIMRPTYGSYNNKVKSIVDMPMILWSVDPLDWKIQDAEKISNHILENVKDGDIILLHDIFVSTAEAVEILVPELINRGFQLVTVSELYEIKDIALTVGNIYSNIK